MKKIFAFALCLSFSVATFAQQYIEKYAKFPEGATLEEKIDIASRIVPTKQQLDWQKMEFTCFLHFGMNTFTGNEWGDGKEDPNLFNPTDLDCEQWVKALRDAGFKMAIITAKHHDGFCLWQTKTTKHSVVSSKWKNGKGDVVRELRDACEKYGLKFGVYLSPWDRNAPSYGDSPEYNKLFVAQLTELLTNYGEVHEVWFDGANAEGPNGKKQIYDWEWILKTIHTLQPHAVTAIMGDDVRWVGNEGGLGRETEWSATPVKPSSWPGADEYKKKLGINEMKKDLGSREILAKAAEIFWYPSEVDVSIRPGWFYHKEQDSKVRSLANLADIYFQSIGRNSLLLLNIPPNREGKFSDVDVKRIKELHEYVTETFANNLLAKEFTAWDANVGDSKVFNIKKGSLANTLLLQEDIARGQHVESFKVEAQIGGKWRSVAEGTTIGYKRLIRFSDCKATKLRVTLTGTRGVAHISNIGVFYAKQLIDNSVRVITSEVPTKNWKAFGTDEALAIDGNRATAWKANSLQALTVDMGEVIDITGFCYTPVAGDDLRGTIYKYNFYVSTDRINWTKCNTSGEFSNIMHNPVPYSVRFDKAVKARYICLEPLAEINGEKATSVGELGVLVK